MKQHTVKGSTVIVTLLALAAFITARQMGWLRGADLGWIFQGVLLIAALALYFAPALVARGSPRFGGVFVVNLFLGWTLIGWVVALAWALSGPAAKQPVQGPIKPAAVPDEDGLTRLAALKDRGMLTDEEFTAAKRRLLSRTQAT